MVRRTPKPFTIEVRNSGRLGKPKVSAPVPSHEMEQPRIAAWPGTDQELAGSSQVAEAAPAAVVVPTGRVLPALEVPVRRAPVLDPEPPEVFDELEPAAEPEEPKAVDLEPPIGVLEADARTVAATLLVRQGRKRLSRDEFRREDRWKARLPAVVHPSRERRSL